MKRTRVFRCLSACSLIGVAVAVGTPRARAVNVGGNATTSGAVIEYHEAVVLTASVTMDSSLCGI